MADLVNIDGADVDIENPCEVVTALRKVELKLAAGAAVVRTRFGEDEVQFTAASMIRLRELIAEYERKCAARQGRRVNTFLPTFNKGFDR